MRLLLPAVMALLPAVLSCNNLAVFHDEKVVVCTIPKSASSLWRRMLRYIQQQKGGSTQDNCSFWGKPGCLLNQPGAPPVLTSEAEARALVARNYTFAHFIRSPVDRVFSMHEGFGHAGGPTVGSMSFATFLSNLEGGMWKGNDHTASAVQLCNQPLGRTEPDWQFWTGTDDPRETQLRAHSFVRTLFGADTYERVCSGWNSCHGSQQQSSDIFYPPVSTGAQRKLDSFIAQGIDVEKYRVRINAMYPDDAHAYDQALARTYPVLAGGCLGLAKVNHAQPRFQSPPHCANATQPMACSRP